MSNIIKLGTRYINLEQVVEMVDCGDAIDLVTTAIEPGFEVAMRYIIRITSPNKVTLLRWFLDEASESVDVVEIYEQAIAEDAEEQPA